MDTKALLIVDQNGKSEVKKVTMKPAYLSSYLSILVFTLLLMVYLTFYGINIRDFDYLQSSAMIPNGSIIRKSLYISNRLKPYSYQSWYYKSYEHYLNMTEEEKAVFFKYKESQYAKRNKWVKNVCRKFRNETLIRKSTKCVPDGKIQILIYYTMNI